MTNTHCLPWGGRGKLARRVVKLVNTCPIDNLLYFIYLALNKDPSALEEIQKKAKDQWLSALLEVHRCFSKREWTDGKIKWLKNFA